MGGGIRRQVPDGGKSYREAGRWRHRIAEGRDIFLDVSANLSVLLKYCHLDPVLKTGPVLDRQTVFMELMLNI